MSLAKMIHIWWGDGKLEHGDLPAGVEPLALLRADPVGHPTVLPMYEVLDVHYMIALLDHAPKVDNKMRFTSIDVVKARLNTHLATIGMLHRTAMRIMRTDNPVYPM